MERPFAISTRPAITTCPRDTEKPYQWVQYDDVPFTPLGKPRPNAVSR